MNKNIMVMNIPTGSVAPYDEWHSDFIDSQERGTLKEEGWLTPFEKNFRTEGLVEVEWNDEEDYWVEV